MSTEFTWTVENCESCADTGAITVAHWRLIGVDGDYSAGVYGTHGVPAAPEGSDFTPYEDVLEQNVLDWCFASGLDKDEKEKVVQSQIDAQKTPAVVEGTPWG